MGLFGGSKTKIPATGYYALPANIRGQYDTAVGNIPGATNPANWLAPDFNQDQISAFDMIRGSANPTEASINGLISPYMNPYIDSVISEVNRQGQGANSVLQQNINSAGQLGSNRQLLGANDIDLSRQNQIGGLLSQQYNNALNTGLTQQQLGITNLLGIGNQQQQQAYSDQQAPFNALSSQFSLLNPVAQFVGGSTPEQTIKTGGGLGGFLGAAANIGSIASGLGGAGGFFGTGGLGGLNQSIGSLFSSSPVGPYQGLFG